MSDYDCPCGASATEACSPDCADSVHADERWGFEQMLRADRAELALAEAERKLARLMQMADSWDAAWGEQGVKAGMVADAVRLTIRPHA